MADVKKIKLPDNSVVNIKDYRIPGIDTQPVENSENVITSGGVFSAIDDIEFVTASALNDLNSRLREVENQELPNSPVATVANAGKVPKITSEGTWEYVTPSTIYSGTGAPDNSQGNNGDIYLQTS